MVRQELSNWRFFHGFRTDSDSALRRPSRAITSPMLASSGGNLASVLATLRHVRPTSAALAAERRYCGFHQLDSANLRGQVIGDTYRDAGAALVDCHQCSDAGPERLLHFINCGS